MNGFLKTAKKRKRIGPAPPTMPTQIKQPTLRFSPTAWAKLLFLRDLGQTEVGGFGISPADDLLRIEDIRLVRQTCSWSHVKFSDQSVADFFDEQVDAGRRPEQFGRIWIHTHPGPCPLPSGTDEQTLARVFGRADWAVMFILAREGATYARIRFNAGPGGDVELATEIDFSRSFPSTNLDSWRREYEENVRDEWLQPKILPLLSDSRARTSAETPEAWYEPWFEYLDDDLAVENRDGYVH